MKVASKLIVQTSKLLLTKGEVHTFITVALPPGGQGHGSGRHGRPAKGLRLEAAEVGPGGARLRTCSPQENRSQVRKRKNNFWKHGPSPVMIVLPTLFDSNHGTKTLNWKLHYYVHRFNMHLHAVWHRMIHFPSSIRPGIPVRGSSHWSTSLTTRCSNSYLRWDGRWMNQWRTFYQASRDAFYLHYSISKWDHFLNWCLANIERRFYLDNPVWHEVFFCSLFSSCTQSCPPSSWRRARWRTRGPTWTHTRESSSNTTGWRRWTTTPCFLESAGL